MEGRQIRKGTTTYLSYFIDNIFIHFVRGIADYFRTDYFNSYDGSIRSKDIIISTYEKGVEHYRQRSRDAKENWKPKYPYIIFDPLYDFAPAEIGGKFYHGYSELDIRNAAKMYYPKVYSDDNLYISPVLNRYEGRFDMTIFCSSFYELTNFRIRAFQNWGGLGRYIYPKDILGYFIMPDELSTYTYDNRYTGESYQLDWTQTDAEAVLIKNINQNKVCFPFTVTPSLILEDVGDGSDKYGSVGEEIGDHRLVISMKWECALPTHLILVSEEFPIAEHKLQIDVGVGFTYTKASTQYTGDDTLNAPRQRIVRYIDDETATSCSRMELIHSQSYNYILTEEDEEKLNKSTPEDIEIPLPVTIDKQLKVKVYGKYGLMDPDFHWKISNSSTLVLIGFAVTELSEGDIISIEIYEETEL